MIIKLDDKGIALDSIKGKYISFAFETEFLDIHSYYYFRILQQNSGNNFMVYPLDTNKENLCELNNNKCYLLLNNEYNEYNDLSNKISIYENNISYKVIYMNNTDYYSKGLNLEILDKFKEIESFKDYINLNFQNNYALVEILANSKENKILTVIQNFLNQQNSSYIDIYSYQLFHLSEGTSQQFYLQQSPFMNYRILINLTEGEGNICLNSICDNNSFITLSEQKIYSFSISNKTNCFIKANKPLTYKIKIIYEISNEAIKELNYQYNNKKIDSKKEAFPLLYFMKDVKYNGININFNFKLNNPCNKNLIIKGYGLDYSEISFIKDKNNIKISNLAKEIKGKYDNITNSGTIELSNELIKTNNKYIEDKYFMIIIENINSNDLDNLVSDIFVISKDKNKILLPINKYIRNSFNLLEDSINQKYFFEKDNLSNSEFILEFSSNYENINLTFINLIVKKMETIGGFKRYILSKDSDDYYFNIEIKPTNKLNLDRPLKEVNIIVKYYNEKKDINTDYVCSKNFSLNKISNRKKYSDYNLIINNNFEISNSSNDLNYIYYLRLIKKNNILNNENLNTIALVSSDLLYINKYNTTEINSKFSFDLSNLENNEEYIASFFIKVENTKEQEEKYYSISYELKDNEESANNFWIIILIIIIIILIIAFILFLIRRKIIFKSRNIEDKINEINFLSGEDKNINNNNQELAERNRKSGGYLNVDI